MDPAMKWRVAFVRAESGSTAIRLQVQLSPYVREFKLNRQGIGS
jgi:hypothetical protein